MSEDHIPILWTFTVSHVINEQLGEVWVLETYTKHKNLPLGTDYSPIPYSSKDELFAELQRQIDQLKTEEW